MINYYLTLPYLIYYLKYINNSFKIQGLLNNKQLMLFNELHPVKSDDIFSLISVPPCNVNILVYC